MDVRWVTRRGTAGNAASTAWRRRPDGRTGALVGAALLVAGTLLVAACGSSATVHSTVGDAVDTPTGAATGAGSARMPVAPGTIVGGEALPGTDGAPAPAPEALAASQGFADEAKIVKTGTLTLEVAKLDDALAAARATISGLGGYVSGTNEANEGDRTQATIVYRIPAARWDDALQRLRGLATKVVGEQTNAVEVTGQVIDLEARIANLRATESALQGIMAKAVKISDVLEVQSQLTAVQGEIEQLSAQKAHLEDQAALGTLTVSFGVPVAAVTATREGWDPATEVDRAVASLMAMLQGLASFAIWFAIVALPVVVTLAVVVAVALIVARRLGLGRPRSGLLPPDAPPAGSPPAPAAPQV